nr:AGC/Akt protein kinase [Naematelia aurantialba]
MLKGVKQLWPSSGQSQSSHTGKDTPSPTLSPSASFAALGGPYDQATPRASALNNPFDTASNPASTPGLSKSAAGLSIDPARRAVSPAPGASSMSSGVRTPTTQHGFGLPPLGTPGIGQPTTGVTVGDQVGHSGSLGFGLHEPPKMRKAMAKAADGTKTPVAGGSPPDSVTPGELEFTSQGGNAQNGHNSHAARGLLNVKLISARGLAVSHSRDVQPQPYVVMQFEQNEFVSRPPRPAASHQSVPFTSSTVQPIAPGNLTRSTSGLGNTISRAFAEAVGRGGRSRKEGDGSGAQTPRAEEPAGGTSWLGKPGPGDPVWKEEVSFDLTSSNSALHVSVYDRSREGEGFLGMLDIKPVLKDGYTLDGWYKLGTRGDEVVTGEVWIQSTFSAIRSKVHLKPSDFEFLKLIGRGTFGRVFQVRKKDTRRIYAMKVLSKKEIIAKKEVAHTIGERKILQRSLECPFLVGLKFSFQTEKELYFVTDYKCGGELFWHLQKEGRFSEDRARFYIAELILALEHLHKYNIVYR